MKLPHMRNLSRFGGRRAATTEFALSEDVFLGDPTTEAVLKKDFVVSGRIVCQANCVAAGVEEAVMVLGPKNCTRQVAEGAALRRGQVVFVVKMRAFELLKRIRTALNFLSHLSGLATNARRLSKKFGKNRLAALRKTTPGLGVSEKAALVVGGVMPHRVNLGDGILIKKEHVTLVQREMGFPRGKAVFEAVTRARGYLKKRRIPNAFVEVEVESMTEAREAARAKPDVIMLDNVSPTRARDLIRVICGLDPEILIEASGGVKETTARGYFSVGVDVVSGSFVLDAKPTPFRFVLDP
jgi:nicotinate-nucleotide pyrophosphorylase (carboxylating)